MDVMLGLVQGLLLLLGPLALGAWCHRRFHVPWAAWLAGAAGFVLSQLVHVPLLVAVTSWHGLRESPLAAMVGLAFLAGICEEPARWVILRYCLGGRLLPRTAAMAGLGHGGFEASLMGVLVLITLLNAVSLPTDAPESLRQLAQQVLHPPALVRFLSVLERISTMVFHVAATMLVFRAVTSRRLIYLAAAVGFHTLYDAVAVVTHARLGIVASEAAVAVVALASVLLIRQVWQADERVEAVSDPLPETDQVIVCRGLSRTFDDRLVVDSLDFTVGKGEVFALLGPNGAGKTTTIRMLCGLIAPSSGQARVAGCPLGGENEGVHARVGILTETPGLYEHLSARANLDIFGQLHGLDPITRAERIEAHLRRFDLWERRDERVEGFSKGMKQKVAIIRALLHEPQVLFLDEPTSGLDTEAAREVLDTVAELRRQGRTIILTTHRLEEAEELANRVGVLKTRLLAVDTVANLQARLYAKAVSVRLLNPGDHILRIVRALPFVQDAHWSDGAMLVVTSDPDADVPLMVRALVEVGADIRGVSDVAHSLEEIYLELVGGRP